MVDGIICANLSRGQAWATAGQSCLEGVGAGRQGYDGQHRVGSHKAMFYRSVAVDKLTYSSRHQEHEFREVELRVAEAENIKCELLYHR